jgi:ribonuclease HI
MGVLRGWCYSYCYFTIQSKNIICCKLQFQCTNNITEYESLLLGLRKLKTMGVRRAILKSDS